VAIQQAAALHLEFGLYQAWIVVTGGQLGRTHYLPVKQAGSHQGETEQDKVGQALDVIGHA
jgi:hypothetical protein